ncbi:acyl-CoA thioesterase [Nocardioides sp. zg-ZUI104]|uniref:acyl-CoA thioesterase n=1 Tax=Nocardioides faecalis TaxID=2803858 RepID=UPI001BCBE33C|nr:thioesterase family protein [Nocardioides faecalis]MBS4751946.1 acyl-CoA thioesterase [Nocardioides faecalis]
MTDDLEGSARRLRFRLAYADTDPAGLVYYAAWFSWMERLQTEWFRSVGLPQDELLEAHGFGTVVAHASCDYLLATRLHDEIEIGVRLAESSARSFVTEHRIVRCTDGALVARGRIVLATVDRDGRSVPVPAVVTDRLRDPGAAVQGADG